MLIIRVIHCAVGNKTSCTTYCELCLPFWGIHNQKLKLLGFLGCSLSEIPMQIALIYCRKPQFSAARKQKNGVILIRGGKWRILLPSPCAGKKSGRFAIRKVRQLQGFRYNLASTHTPISCSSWRSFLTYKHT